MHLRKNNDLSNNILAAGCFWRKDLVSNQIPINDDLYKIVAPYFDTGVSVIGNDDDSYYNQIINVSY